MHPCFELSYQLLRFAWRDFIEYSSEEILSVRYEAAPILSRQERSRRPHVGDGDRYARQVENAAWEYQEMGRWNIDAVLSGVIGGAFNKHE